MGRRRSIDLHLPPHLYRKGKCYYYDAGGKPRKWIRLGSDLNEARRRWADLEGREEDPEDRAFAVIARRYEREIIPQKARSTQTDNARELKQLLAVFGEMPVDEISPADVREYLDRRGEQAQVRANREKALLSHILNQARAWGYMRTANPCAGIKGFRESGRDRFVTDAEFDAVRAVAHSTVADAMALALLTGQRPADVLKMRRTDVREGALHVTQNKTGKRIAFSLTDELKALVARLLANPKRSDYLLCNEDGSAVSSHQLRQRFDSARVAAGVNFQFRDIRAKAGTEASINGGMDHAQKLLGHKHVTMTQHYVRARVGERVEPLRKPGIVENEPEL
jgi:integrase